MWELDCEESWAPKNWCFWTVVLEKTLASPLNCKEIQLVHPKGDQSWVFTGRTYVEVETPILWPPLVKSWLIGKDSDAGRDWGQEEKGMTEDEMAGWHHRLNGRESEWTLGVADGQGGLACCDSWGPKESATTERLNWLKVVCLIWGVRHIAGDTTLKSWSVPGSSSQRLLWLSWPPFSGFLLFTRRQDVDGLLSWRLNARCNMLDNLQWTFPDSLPPVPSSEFSLHLHIIFGDKRNRKWAHCCYSIISF